MIGFGGPLVVNGQIEQSITVDGMNIYIYEAELLYNDSEIPFSMDGSFATLKKNSAELYYWEHSYGITYKYHGPLDDPLQTQDWEKPKTEVFDYNGKADPNKTDIWIYNIYKRDNGDLLGFCHIEKYDDTNVVVGFAIGLVYSTNNGDYWTYCGEIIKPQQDTVNVGGVPYLVVGDYFYVYFNEWPLNKNSKNISVARANMNDVLNAAAYKNVVSWKKYNSLAWSQDGLTGVGSNIIPDITTRYDVHSDAAYNRALDKYMLTVQTHSLGQLLLYTSIDGVNWENKIIIDETDENDFIQAYSCFASLSDATDDCREVGSEFYIIYPRKDHPDNYGYDELYRRLITIGFEKTPPPPTPLTPLDRYIFSNDSSSIQGQNQWYYQYKTNSSYTNMTWDSDNNRWKGGETYSLIGNTWLHPGNDSDAVLKWVAPKNGLITINGTAIDIGTGGTACTIDDGVAVKILQGNTEIWSQTLNIGGSAKHNLPLSISAGETIYFIVNKRNNSNCDTTHWNPIISYYSNLLAQQTIYFPHVASDGTWETEICIINTGSEQNLGGILIAYNNTGQQVELKPIILTPKARREISVVEEFSDPSSIGYIVLMSDSESVGGYTKFYIEGKYRVAIPIVLEVNAGDIYISHIASNTNWWTGISLLNTTSSSKELTIEFDNGTTITQNLLRLMNIRRSLSIVCLVVKCSQILTLR
jgi:hypothetical protein